MYLLEPDLHPHQRAVFYSSTRLLLQLSLLVRSNALNTDDAEPSFPLSCLTVSSSSSYSGKIFVFTVFPGSQKPKLSSFSNLHFDPGFLDTLDSSHSHDHGYRPQYCNQKIVAFHSSLSARLSGPCLPKPLDAATTTQMTIQNTKSSLTSAQRRAGSRRSCLLAS
jgi:hypothetical protein